MPEYGFSLTCIFLYKNRIKDPVLSRENTDRRKPLYWHVLRSVIGKYLIVSEILFLKSCLTRKFDNFWWYHCLLLSLTNYWFTCLKTTKNLIFLFWGVVRSLSKIYDLNFCGNSSIKYV